MSLGAIYIRETEHITPNFITRISNAVVIVFASAAGLYVVSNTMGLCKRITAFPAAKSRNGVRLVVEGKYFWLPWKTRIVEADMRDVVIAKSMADSLEAIRRKPVPRMPDDQVPPIILRLNKFGREFGACVRELPHVCFGHTHPSIQIRSGKQLELVQFRLDIRGQAFGGARGEFACMLSKVRVLANTE